MYSYNECQEIIEKRISEIKFSNFPGELYQPVQYILSIGGKRLRPCLALIACNMFSDSPELALDPAIGIEIFHNFTLLHDDIMDNAPVRRNHETVHVKWNNNTAILSGDAMMIIAYDFIAQSPKESFPEVFKLFNRTALEVCEGQQYDMNFEKQNNVSEKEYIEMIRLKTSVLLSASLAIGGVIAKTSKDNISKLYELGENIGLAFQVQDDFLDVFASSSKFGKSLGGDILSNKKTYLLISALNSKNSKLVAELNYWIRKTSFDPQEKINSVTAIFEQMQIKTKTEELIEYYFAKGTECLKQISVEDKRKEILLDLINKTKKREY